MKKTYIILLVFFLGTANTVFAGVTETLPTYHWAYGHIDELRVRGYFSGLLFTKKPFSRGEIAAELAKIKGSGRYSTKVGWLLSDLFEEFTAEIDALSDGASDEMLVGLLTQAGIQRANDKTSDFEIIRTKAGYLAGENLYLYNSMTFDGSLPDDTTFVGRHWRGMSAFTEQAYINYTRGALTITAGRDFQRFT